MQENGREAAFQHKRCELNVKRMKKGSLLPPKLKQTSRAGVFTEQIRLVEEKHKVDVSIIDDVQEFMRARAKVQPYVPRPPTGAPRTHPPLYERHTPPC